MLAKRAEQVQAIGLGQPLFPRTPRPSVDPSFGKCARSGLHLHFTPSRRIEGIELARK
jgi:hypothetical protein